IDDRKIGQVQRETVEQRSRVADRSDDVVTAPGQSLGQAVPHDGGILGDNDAERGQGRGGHQACPGSEMVTVVGPPQGLARTRRPSTVWARSRRPARPPPTAMRAPPPPSSVTVMTTSPSCSVTDMAAPVARPCLAMLASSSEAQK